MKLAEKTFDKPIVIVTQEEATAKKKKGFLARKRLGNLKLKMYAILVSQLLVSLF